MGQRVQQQLQKEHQVTIIAQSEDAKQGEFDVIIDFSHPNNLEGIIRYVEKNPIPLVIATTGYTPSQLVKIEKLALKVPVLFSANFSLGVTLMNRVVQDMSRVLADAFDIEVIEKHHHLKVDAPSGTAKMLVDSLNQTLNYQVVHGREGMAKRTKKEIGVHTIRGGSIVGEHEVLFAGADELISIKHEALSKSIFATGAIRGAQWLLTQAKGLYQMEDVLFPQERTAASRYQIDDLVAKGESGSASHA